MVRLVLGCVVYLSGAFVLGAMHVVDWPFLLPILAIAPIALLGGLLMGLHEDPPPWRRHTHTR